MAEKPIKERLVDDAMQAYAHWLEECMLVGDSHGRWGSAPAADARLAFVACVAALDREQQAAKRDASLWTVASQR